MNGRELTADDVVFNLHRLTGTGSGFTEPRGAESGLLFLEYESIEATDKYTVVIKVKEPKMDLFTFFIDDNLFFINPPEVLKEHGDIADWKTLVGTGPFELIDFVEGDSLTYSKNPNYWGYDEKYPENRLPYVDQLRGLLIIETATYIAALRAGKVDYLGANVSTMLKSVDQALSLQRTNPEIRTNAFYFRANNAYSFNQTVPPFTDINVRKAMQMSLDLETINDTYFFGLARTEPQGIIASWQKGWTTPYAEWPEEVKAGYRYDPEGAEALLDAAGYPRGADGIRFSTAVNVPSGEIDALHYAEVVTGFWREIGVDVEILSWEGAVHHSNRQAGYDGMRPQVAATPYPPMNMLEWHYPGNFWNTGGWDDPVYNAIVEKARTATTVAELQPLSREGLFYVTKKHWYIWSPMAPWFNFTQPWVQGFAGDHYFAGDNANSVFARLWIDQDMKEAMGR